MTTPEERIALAALQTAGAKFREYERLHMAKGSIDGGLKARTNCEMAEMCEQAASALRQSPERTDGLSERIFRHIEHGDEKHRAWLKDELDKFFAAESTPSPEGPRDEEIADEWRDKVCAFIEKQEGFDWNDYRDGLDADLAVEWLRETIDALSRPFEIEKR